MASGLCWLHTTAVHIFQTDPSRRSGLAPPCTTAAVPALSPSPWHILTAALDPRASPLCDAGQGELWARGCGPSSTCSSSSSHTTHHSPWPCTSLCPPSQGCGGTCRADPPQRCHWHLPVLPGSRVGLFPWGSASSVLLGTCEVDCGCARAAWVSSSHTHRWESHICLRAAAVMCLFFCGHLHCGLSWVSLHLQVSDELSACGRQGLCLGLEDSTVFQRRASLPDLELCLLEHSKPILPVSPGEHSRTCVRTLFPGVPV
ncbi:uncharacterized protein LOC117286772 [Fukomys damarensis]|uniref:uncharacterized protein LOC117286772 n=1 Tax=Fukomys damarensis TaxID=885580 RepID=UPI00145556FC|nr:uncharacterized protein LOC117286772 [Fukomys damarensis]